MYYGRGGVSQHEGGANVVEYCCEADKFKSQKAYPLAYM